MERHYAILKMQKLNRDKVKEIQMRYEHVSRKGYADNVDASRSKNNKILVGNNDISWWNLIERRKMAIDDYASEKVKLRKDAVIGLEFVATMSHENADTIDIDKWCKKNIEWFKKKYGEANVLSAVLHMDESTPHIHVLVTPIVDDRFNGKLVVGNRNTMNRTQEEYAKAMEEFGLIRGIERTPIHYSSMKELYNNSKGNYELPDPIEGEDVDDYRIRVQDELRNAAKVNHAYEQQAAEADALRERVHHDEEMMLALRKRVQDSEEELEEYKRIKEKEIQKYRESAGNYDAIQYALNNFDFGDEENKRKFEQAMKDLKTKGKELMKLHNVPEI